MELNYNFLFRRETKDSLEKLFSNDFDPKVSYNIRKIKYHCERNFKELSKSFNELLKKYAEKDEKGNVLPGKDGQMFTVKGENKEKYDKEFVELLKKTFDLPKCEKIQLSTLLNSRSLKISSLDIENLEPILTGLDWEV